MIAHSIDKLKIIKLDIILLPFRVLYKIYLWTYVVISLIIFYPFLRLFLSKEKRFPIAFKIIRLYAKLWLLFSGVLVKVKGRENIIKGKPFIISANHSSFIDPTVLYSVLDEYFVFTGKQEIEKWPLFNIFYTSGMNILVDRNSRMGVLRSFKRMMSVIDDGKSIVILPEGTISNDAPKLAEFKTGAASIAIQKQIPILPITFTTNWKLLQRKGFLFGKASPGICEMIIHPPIDTIGLNKNNTEELNLKLRDVINEPLHAMYGV